MFWSCIFLVVMALLYFSTVISDLKGRTKELAQELALLKVAQEEGDAGPRDVRGEHQAGSGESDPRGKG